MSAGTLARAHQHTREKEEESVEGKELRRLFLNQNQTLRRRDRVGAQIGGSACVCMWMAMSVTEEMEEEEEEGRVAAAQ